MESPICWNHRMSHQAFGPYLAALSFPDFCALLYDFLAPFSLFCPRDLHSSGE
jgi:hypothetical protein